VFLVGVSCKWQTVNDSVFIDINKTMKRFLTTVLLFVVASVLLHCNAQAPNTNVVSAQSGEGAHQLEVLLDVAHTVFEEVEVVPLDPEADPTEPDNLMLVCQRA